MAGLASLIGSALGSAGDAVQKVLVQFEADTTALDRAAQKLQETATREEQVEASKMAKLQQLYAEEAALETKYYANRAELVRASALGADAEVVALTKRREAIALQIEQSQTAQAQISREIDLLAQHRAMLLSDAAASAETAAGRVGGPGTSAAGGAALGAIGGMLALTAVQALQRAVDDAVMSYVKWGHEVEHTSGLLGTNAQNASVLLYVFERFNLTTADADRVIIQLSRHVEENEAKFAALGVQTRNANGEFKSAFDIFDQVRQVMSKSADGITKNVDMMELLARSSAGGGQSFAELNAILNLTDAQMAALREEATRMGFVLSDEAARKAFLLQNEMRGLQQEGKGLQIVLAQAAVPALEALVNWATRAAATINFAAQSSNNFTVALANMAAGWLKFVGQIPGLGLAGAAGGIIQGLVPADSQRSLDDFVNQAVENAKKIGEAFDQLNQPAPPDVSNAAMKDGSKAATDAVQDEIKAVQELARAQEEAMRAGLLRFEREQQAAIASIEARQRADQEALRTSDEAHQADITNLREEVRLREQALQLEDRQYNLARDQRSLAEAQGASVSIGPNESIESYYKRVNDQRRKIEDETHKVSMDQKRLALDLFKSTTDEQIAAIEKQRKAEKEAYDARKLQNDDQIRYYRDLIQTGRDATNNAIKDLQDQTRVKVDELNKQLEAIRNHATNAAAAWRSGSTTRVLATVYTQTGTPPSTGTPVGPVGPQGPTRGGGGGGSFDPMAGAGSGPLLFADGGSMMLTEPTGLFSMRSGALLAVAGEKGPEVASFGGRGGTQVIQLIVDGKKMYEVIVPHLARDFDQIGAAGFGRRS